MFIIINYKILRKILIIDNFYKEVSDLYYYKVSFFIRNVSDIFREFIYYYKNYIIFIKEFWEISNKVKREK